MALIREKRFSQMNLSLHVPSRAPFQEAAAARRQCPPPVAPPSTSSTPASRASQFRLADFERVAVLGSGNGGTVYKVRHRETCALYALKVQHSSGGELTGAAEADILSRTASPFVVRCHAVLPASAFGDVALLLELVDGGSLDAVRSRAGAFPEAAVAEVAAQALSALAYLHARRVVHLDVKPANLLASTAGEVKLADFGIARVLPRAGDHCTSYVGTAAYMSPERFDPEAHGGRYDPLAADVWSLGVTVLELLVGRYPLLPAGQKPSWAALMCAICFGEPPALPDGAASPELRGFVAACLRKDYRERASVGELLAHPFVAGRDVTASRRALRRLVAEASSPSSERRLPQLHISLDLPSCAGAGNFRAAPASASAAAAAARAGELRVSDFDRVAVLGRGNGGAVYKVVHRRTSAVYALKVLHGGGDPGAAAATEADVLRRADSPHVVRCHSVMPAAATSDSGDVALLLELVDGGSLASVAARAGAFPEAALAEVAAQALSGLSYLHARRVVHRDIKPANLLVSTAGEVKIADFGIAKVLPPRPGEHREAYEYEGTAAYMSPERFDSELHGDADPFAGDVWGMGVTILELLMGRYPLLPPGQKPSWAALMCAICFGELPLLPDGAASPELRAFLAACLHKDYAKRASVAQLLAHQFIAGRDVAASKLALRRLVAGA
uniref:mitogen-activated protein kinase kinase n=1 Tax=Oryza punctata TaxID=4537 RepID=A0A0E0KI77_ORYPU